MRRKKRGSFTVREAVYLAFSAIILLTLSSFGSKLYGAIVGEKDDGSLANMNRLYGAVKELTGSKCDKDYMLMNYFLSNDRYLVGFDTKWNDQIKAERSYQIYRPFKCGTSACLCLYDSESTWYESDNRGEDVVSCRSDGISGKNIIFKSESNPIRIGTIGNKRSDHGDSYLVFNGDHWEDKKMSSQQIYIEKEKKGDDIHFYISPIDITNSNDPANQRRSSITKTTDCLREYV